MDKSEKHSMYNEVFVSYSRNDRDFAKRLVNTIYEKGYKNVWVDWEDIEYAEDWWQKIESGIESANNFVFLLTPNSATSDVCFKEVHHAVKSGKRIIPILHQTVSQEEKESIHPAISQHNWLPLGDKDDFAKGVDMLIKTISTDLEHVRYHTRLLTRARDWQDENRSQARILTSGELKDAKSWLASSDQQLKDPRPTRLHREFIKSSDHFYRRRLRGILAVLFIISTLILSFLVFQNIQTQALEAENRALARVISLNDFGPSFGWEEFTIWTTVRPSEQLVAFGEDEDRTGFLQLFLGDGGRNDSTEGYTTNAILPADLDIEVRFRIQEERSDLPHDFEIWLGRQTNSFVAVRYYNEHAPDIAEVNFDNNPDNTTFVPPIEGIEGIEIGQWYITNIELRNGFITIYIDGEQVQSSLLSVYGEGGRLALVGGGDAIVDVDYLNIQHPE